MATIRKRGDYQWQAQIRKRGYPKQVNTFNTKAEAEAWARRVESEMDRGAFAVGQAEADRTTLGEALERYWIEIASKKRYPPSISKTLRSRAATAILNGWST